MTVDKQPNAEPAATNVTRRTFLKVSSVAAAAAAGSSEVFRRAELRADPDPPASSGAVFLHTTCRLCESHCGMKAKLVAGELVKLEGNPYHPVNRGDADRRAFTVLPAQTRLDAAPLCARGHAALQLVYDPSRVQHPLRRVGPRGSGRWESITWDVAFAEIGARINALIPFAQRTAQLIDSASPQLGPIANQLVLVHGTGSDRALAERLFRYGYGTANAWITESSTGDANARAGTSLATRDTVTGAAGRDELAPDLASARHVLLFGASPFESARPMVALSRQLTEFRDPARAGGAGTVTVVDPRFSATAGRADRWVPVRPGGDLAVALGIARVILDGDRQDSAYLANANAAAATAAGQPAYTDATWLVVVEPGHARLGQFLTAADAGLASPRSSANPVCAASGDGAITEVDVSVPTGVTPRAATGRLRPSDTGQTTLTVNGIRCKTAFALYREAVFERSLEAYATLAGVPAATLSAMASDFLAAGRRAVAWAGGGATQHTNGTYLQLAVLALNWLVGNVDRAGGLMRGGVAWDDLRAGTSDVMQVSGGVTPTGVRMDRAGSAYAQGQPWFQGFPAPRPWFPNAGGAVFQELLAGIEDGYPYPVKALVACGDDAPWTTPGALGAWQRAVADETRLPLFVAVSTVLNESSSWADYVLPEGTFLESWGVTGASASLGAALTSVQQPVIGTYDGTPIGGRADWQFEPGAVNEYRPYLPDTRTRADILLGLARAISGTFPGVGTNGLASGRNLDRAWDLYRFRLELLARNVGTALTGGALSAGDITARGGVFALPGSTYDTADPTLQKSRHGGVLHFHAPSVATQPDPVSGTLLRGTAHWRAPAHLDGTSVVDGAFPLQLITYRPAIHTGWQTAASTWLLGLAPRNAIELSPRDARALGVETGDFVRLVSASDPVGVVGAVKTVEGLRPGVVAVAQGFGHWEHGARAQRVDGRLTPFDPARAGGVNVHPLLRLDQHYRNAPLQDPVGGGCAFNDTWVRIEPLSAGS